MSNLIQSDDAPDVDLHAREHELANELEQRAAHSAPARERPEWGWAFLLLVLLTAAVAPFLAAK